MNAGPTAVPVPKTTIRFDNDPELFSDPSCLDFYQRVVQLVNNAAMEHGDGFSVLFRLLPGDHPRFSHLMEKKDTPYASIQWCGKTLLLITRSSYKCVDVALKETGNDRVATYFDNADWQSNPTDVLAPILLEHYDWKVYKAEKDLAAAIAERDALYYFDC